MRVTRVTPSRPGVGEEAAPPPREKILNSREHFGLLRQ